MLTVPPSAKVENQPKLSDSGAETSNADGKTGVADGRLTVGTVSNLPPFCGACTSFDQEPASGGLVHQANIAHGPQQVNTASAAPGDTPCAGAGENQNLKNELLEKTDGDRLDIGTTCAPGRIDPAMATVGEVNGAEDRGW